MKSNFIFLFLLPYPTIPSFNGIFASEKTELIVTLFLFLFCPSITRTFASGKTEKVIFQALKELGLPSGKVFINLIMFLKPLCVFMFSCNKQDCIKLIQLDSELDSVTHSTVNFSFILFPSILPSFCFLGILT